MLWVTKQFRSVLCEIRELPKSDSGFHQTFRILDSEYFLEGVHDFLGVPRSRALETNCNF
jgi:hypothetical protein